jgi:hypothetical protein
VNDGSDSELDPEWMDEQVEDDDNADYFAQEEPTELLTLEEIVSIVKEVIFEHVDHEMADCKNKEDMPSPERVGSWGHFAAPTHENCAPSSETPHMDDAVENFPLAPFPNYQPAPPTIVANGQGAPRSFAAPVAAIAEPRGSRAGRPSTQ